MIGARGAVKMLSKAKFPHVYKTLTKVDLVLTGP